MANDCFWSFLIVFLIVLCGTCLGPLLLQIVFCGVVWRRTRGEIVSCGHGRLPAHHLIVRNQQCLPLSLGEIVFGWKVIVFGRF